MDQWDLGTYTGISFAVVAVIGAIKKLFPDWVKGKEPHLGLIFSYMIGVSAKALMPVFTDVHWVIHCISLLIVAAGAKIGHDYIVNQIMVGKPSPGEKKE